ncbi:MAG TPA: hypothetical protein PLV87_17585, partial [Opitutaceae bacterium]|nr:hypothetical protein [Opitutaceae bacterium]
IECDGHDLADACRAFYQAKYLEMKGRPVAIIAHTVKGRGLPEAEFNYHWHTHAPSVAQAENFLIELNRTYERNGRFSRPLSSPKDAGLEDVVSADLNPA